MRSYVGMLRAAMAAWSVHRASSMGAAVAFYASFSLAPMFVIVIAVAGLFFGEDAARGEIVAQLSGLIGVAGAQAIEGFIEGARNLEQGFWASLIAIVTLLLAATSAFAELKDSLDVIWDVKPEQRSGWMSILRGRFLSFGLILTLSFLLLVSLVISALLTALQKYWGPWFSGAVWLGESLNSLISFFVVSTLFAIIYKWLPQPAIAWRDVTVGALVTAALFTLGKYLIGVYLGNSAVASSFGAAGSLIVILLWVYYSSQIFFFGAEFTRVYADHRGSRS
ncbi:MAG: YihY/virulence factor BrkB family protein [Gammaproteobacteria bacterium]|nr:YihY/virulence factor BrkB family protein [Gammaproteobacteria bacterium]